MNLIINDDLMKIAYDESVPRNIRKQIFDDRDLEQKISRLVYNMGFYSGSASKNAKELLEQLYKNGFKSIKRIGKWYYAIHTDNESRQYRLNSKLEADYILLLKRRLG